MEIFTYYYLEEVPSHLYKLNKGNFNSYLIDPNDKNHIITGGAKYLWKFWCRKNFVQTLDEVVYAIKDNKEFLYIATANGIYKKNLKVRSGINIF